MYASATISASAVAASKQTSAIRVQGDIENTPRALNMGGNFITVTPRSGSVNAPRATTFARERRQG